MKTIVFGINWGISDDSVYKTIAELKKLNVGANILRQDTHRLLVIKFPKNTSLDSIMKILQVVMNELLS